MKHLDLQTIETSGFHLIEASAGTGKTWTITALYILLLLEERMRPEEILVVTYTKSATAELRDRIRTRISDTLELYNTGRPPRDELEKILLEARCTDRETAVKLLTRALYSFDDAAIYTIHGFCQRALLENAFESGSLFDTDMISDQTTILRDVCDDFWRLHIMSESEPFLKRLFANGYTPGKLAVPFKGNYQNPALAIIPATVDTDLPALVALSSRITPDLARIWIANRENIIDTLLRANLSQTSYKPSRIESAAIGLDRWLATADYSAPCDSLKLFTAAAIITGQKKGSMLPDHPFFDLCQQLHDNLQQIELAFNQRLIGHQTALHTWMQQELADRKRSLNQRCYDDLLIDLHAALAGPAGSQLAHNLRLRYHAALIDEFQDTDPLQWKIFHSIGNQEGYPLYLIGDPKQAIYSFRGADIYAYIAAGQSVDERNRSTLVTNRRSVAPLVTAVNSLFESADDPFLCRDISFSPVDSGRDPGQMILQNGQPLEHPLQFWVYPRTDQSQAVRKNEACRSIVRTVAEEIARLLDGTHEIIGKKGRRSINPGDIAVLVKAHYQADLVQSALNDIGIPSVQHGSATIFESAEALDMLRILRAVHEPSRERLIREALLTGSMGFSANQIAEFLASGEDSVEWEIWLRNFHMLHDAAQTGGVMSMAGSLLGECGMRKRILTRIGGERILTNILQCVELLHREEQEHASGLEVLILWLERCISAEISDDTALLRLETDENAVQLSTIHASKGLEYPIVFLPFSWDAPSNRTVQTLFHDPEGTLTLDLGSPLQDEHKFQAKQELAAEAARLLYVAITRAEFLCYVIWGCISDAYSAPLFKLLHGTAIKDAKEFKSYPDSDILSDIAALGEKTDGLSAVFMPVDHHTPDYRARAENIGPPVCRTLAHPISNDWRVTSFSAIIAGSERNQQPHDYDALPSAPLEALPDEPAKEGLGRTIFDFPRGTGAGTCLHTIFERLNFAALDIDHISECSRLCLLENGYHESWLPAVNDMISAVTQQPLLTDYPDFTLSHLTTGSWQTEMEFYLPIAMISPEKLRQLFAGFLDPDLHCHFDSIISELDFRQSRGMLHGFMDMIFMHEGRYYIIDWKSNHLGSSCDKYSQYDLSRSMADHAYILQYHLYVLALDRHLRHRIPDYDYETHFGGILYVYLRGVSAEIPGFGVYRDKPAAEFIRRANELLLAQTCHNNPTVIDYNRLTEAPEAVA
jgi:exodeoxyribonuclease V beta subunit